jgi:polar amino acid transport system permease protein
MPEQTFLIAGLIYLVMSFVLVQGFKLLERYLRVDASQGR